jgi:hypothetical protein
MTVLVLVVLFGLATVALSSSKPATKEVAVEELIPATPVTRSPTIEELCDQQGGKYIEGGKWGTSFCIKKEAVIF